MPSMLMAIIQGLVSSAAVYAAFCGIVVLYALLRYRSGEMAWFTAVAFFIMAMYVTQVSALAVDDYRLLHPCMCKECFFNAGFRR